MPLRAEKSDFAKALATRLGLSEREAKRALDGVLELLVERMRRDGTVALWGLGRFEVVDVSSHRRRNPRTGEAVVSPIRAKSVRFRPSHALREQLD